MGYEEIFLNLRDMGFTHVVLPFILVFTIVFAALQKTKILGDSKKQYNVVVALVMGAAFVTPSITGDYLPLIGFDPVETLNRSLPQVSIILVAIVMLLLIIGVFGNELDFAGTPLSGWIVLLAFAAVVLIFGNATGFFRLPDWLDFLREPQIQSLVVMILVFGIIIWFVTKDDTPKKEGDKGLLEKYFGSPMQKKK